MSFPCYLVRKSVIIQHSTKTPKAFNSFSVKPTKWSNTLNISWLLPQGDLFCQYFCLNLSWGYLNYPIWKLYIWTRFQTSRKDFVKQHGFLQFIKFRSGSPSSSQNLFFCKDFFRQIWHTVLRLICAGRQINPTV